ncbi:M14 family metallopeptidase [Desertibacillus haloalkaliphilus]|uniref:M14 family metallopeptidase n=1 Tax=Desertibacillus haloalkaliphilus TaxID=1328930 RepID=UPI001C25915E|nr:M14 family metallopeptidase [Desertibacillus haloalkaliphilus]MBU8907194.1 LysM peptidoglycan-binding domain-containing protein [Desertibacillus haloalkaliphilus]
MKTYIVKPGDTIHKVAYHHQIRPFDLLIFNPQLITDSDYIYPGDAINIPQVKQEKQQVRPSFEYEYGPVDLEYDVNELQRLYSRYMKTTTIGYSVMGKPIMMVKIGTGKKEVFYSGAWHANEWLTGKFLMMFLKQCLHHIATDEKWFAYDLRAIFKEVTLVIVPMVNPDGVELVQQGIYPDHPYFEEVLYINKGARRFDHWSSNIRGVDLNHQWPAGWDIEAKESPQEPWPRHYSGQAPLTEPEAKAIYNITNQHQFAYVLAFHSQGQVIYWGYRGYEPDESKEMVTKLSLASSYEPIHTADSDGGYKDWFIQETGRPGFTIEVGNGTNPLPLSAFSEIWSNNAKLALAGLCL